MVVSWGVPGVELDARRDTGLQAGWIAGGSALRAILPRNSIRARESMSRLLAAVILIGIAANGDAAKGEPQQSDRRTVLLHQLRGCLNEVPALVDVPYTSPCAHMNVSILSGISRADLIAGLGKPQWCYGKEQGGRPVGDDCPLEATPVWHFYQLPRTYIGGGAELACITDKELRCYKVVWKISQ